MRIRFTKMQGAGNDFVVLDETRGELGLTQAQYRFLADRHFGVGADQILSVRAASQSDVDFDYVIHNADGGQVEQCGNGARCFARYVRDHGLSQADEIRVKTLGGVIAPRLCADGRVTVDMGAPRFDLEALAFNPQGVQPQTVNSWQNWPLESMDVRHSAMVNVALVSMGNPHAVQRVDDVDTAPVASQGPWIATHERFAQGVNAGFMQVLDRAHIRLRVHERGAGETLACGTGACAAVVAGIRMGLLDSQVQVQTRGGMLDIAWAGGDAHVQMTGPAVQVFESEIDLPG